MTWVNTFGLIIAFGRRPLSFLMRFNEAGIGVGVLLFELPFTDGAVSSFFGWMLWAVDVAVGFSVLGFGDFTGFGLSTFFGLNLPTETVVVQFAFAESNCELLALVDSSALELSAALFGLDLLVAIVNVDFNESN